MHWYKSITSSPKWPADLQFDDTVLSWCSKRHSVFSLTFREYTG